MRNKVLAAMLAAVVLTAAAPSVAFAEGVTPQETVTEEDGSTTNTYEDGTIENVKENEDGTTTISVVSDDGIVTVIVDGDGATITEVTAAEGTNEAVVDDTTADGTPITSLSKGSVSSNVEKIKIKVKTVEAGAAKGGNLKEVDLDGVETIGQGAFANNPLETVKIGSNLKSIDKNAFKGAKDCTFEIPAGMSKKEFKKMLKASGLKNLKKNGIKIVQA